MIDCGIQIAQTTKAYDAVKAEWDKLQKHVADDVNTLFESLFENKKILTIVDDNKGIWFKANDVCSILEYIKLRDAVLNHVEKHDRISFSEIKSCAIFSGALKMMPLKNSGIKITYQTIFINESGVNSLILGSKKPIAKKFKKWLTSEVIPSIRMKGKYVHKDHKPKKFIEDGIPTFTHKSVLCDHKIKHYLENYHNDEYVDVIDYLNLHKQLLNNNICLQYFDKKHVLYYFITSITNMIDKRVIIKFGYTADLMERYNSLQKEYDCKFVLAGAKVVHSQQDEKAFHKMLKTKYSELNYRIKLNDKFKDELYYYDTRIVKEFCKFVPSKVVSDKDISIAKYSALQEYYKMKTMEFEMKKLEYELELAKLKN